MNLFIQHRVQLQELKADEDRRRFSVGAISMEVTLRHPVENGLRALISALNRSTYGCREETQIQTKRIAPNGASRRKKRTGLYL
jgi:hypothetical protein